jgi:FkbM family methyltransferase
MPHSVVALLLLLTAAATLLGTPAGRTHAATDVATEPAYRTGRASRDGIGKFYLGREISHVMGHRGAGWLERPGREQEERTDLLIENLPLSANTVVADIGAGTGYFAFPVAQRVPQGRVLAVDIQPEMLAKIERRKQEHGITNVEAVQGTITDPNLGIETVDLIYIVDAYHEFSHPLEMGTAMAQALKPGGRLVLIEYRMEDAAVPIKRLHKMSQAQAKREMDALGLEWERTEDFLPQQHFMVFRKRSETMQ